MNKIYKILIAENNSNIALDLYDLLSDKKYIIETAHPGNDLITSVKKTIPDLIIYPLLLGDSKTNLDSLIYFQNKFKYRIIFIGGKVELKYYKGKLQSGLLFFLEKPYTPSDLLALIEKSLN